MPITPLPQFEADMEAARKDREAYEKLRAPTSMVVRFGTMRLIGEYPYSGDAKPGCGSKIVVRTHRGVEIGEMLTSTCPNAGCSKSVTRQEMLEYIENSGGSDYPFYSNGKVLRVATLEDMNEQARLESLEPTLRKSIQAKVDEHGLEMKIVQVEPILGGERLTVYFMSEQRIDFRDVVRDLAQEHSARIEMRQVGARDEARLTADYERCGQHCCCKQFLKVLKPISMKSAKQQKATLDPLKISGRCGRLMCCLRYEDQTYADLIKRLPKMRRRVGTPYGVGIVIDRQVLTQLVLVLIDDSEQRVAVPVEEIVAPEDVEKVLRKPEDPMRGMETPQAEARTGDRSRRRRKQDEYRDRSREEKDSAPSEPAAPDASESVQEGEERTGRRRRRRRGGRGRKRRGGGESDAGSGPESGAPGGRPPEDSGADEAGGKRRRRGGRRRRRGGRRGKGDSGGSGESGGSSAE